jgi:hypothetical protein
MDNSEQTDEKLMQYLDGELTGEELSAFKQVLNNNPDMHARLESLELAKTVVQHYGLKQQVSAVHHQMMAELKNELSGNSRGKIYPLLRLTMKIAAGVIIFIFFFAAYEWVTVSSSGLAESNYYPYELSVDRGAAGSSAIEQAYADHNFKEVILNLEKDTAPSEKDHFLGGQAYLATHQVAKAIREFNKVLLDSRGRYRDDAEYYLALSYLQNDQPLEAQKLVDQIYRDKDHLYHDRLSYWTRLRLQLLILKAGNRH